ncbi:class I SAM-dependent methyltransferase [Deinococcus sp. KSM4-11]|uniref:SAM-dependent methyltransferase n=1 Tax=Deinococcus sp. KSM4-11 TaxID=2568654 RepID=UPI0010A4074E|nr:class I SAM-dependent methyltransferase [Deinococcus sp. KSM4-11]THF85091.1 class I SAM-dependent methyltransferase [Deinococcus sp. KSM4-11]
MDFLEFFSIVEQERDILNPVSPEKLARVAGYAGVKAGADVLDVGSGKGALLRQWAQTWGIRGTGLELNPAFVQEARWRAPKAGRADLTFVEGPALDFTPDARGYDVVTCIGATFALGGFPESLAWMRLHVRSGGSLVIGDVYRQGSPIDEALTDAGWSDLPTLDARYAQFTAAGLEVVGFVAASTDDWDHYSTLMWNATRRWAVAHPNHPDRAEVLENVRAGRERYFRFERAHLNWAIWVAREAAT